MKKRVLMLASVASMITQFNMDNIRLLLSLGYEVDVACNFQKGNTCLSRQVEDLRQEMSGLGVRCYQINFARGIKSAWSLLSAYRLVSLLTALNGYACIHCHSPVGGLIGRLVAHRQGCKVIYTAHGFHFFKGSPARNWILFYPVEKILSCCTDVLVTINQEDFRLARKCFKAKQTEKIPGVGIDTQHFAKERHCREEYRKRLGLDDNDFVVISVGELCRRKNHEVVIRAIHRIQDQKVKYVIAGHGDRKPELLRLSEKLGVADRVMFLDYRTDIPELFQMSDVFAFPSKREGLGLAAIEAMSAGLPVITSDVNGINDYSKNKVTGYVCAPDDAKGFSRAILKCRRDPGWCARVGRSNQRRARKYDIANARSKMREIYQSI